MKKRIEFIDIARGFAIFFIVLGHTIVHSEHCSSIFKGLYSFHVVLFFVISGYTFSVKEKYLVFLKNKFLRIMVPYFIWGIVFLIPYMLLGKGVENSLGTVSSFDMKTQIINVFYGNGNFSSLKQNSSLWFLPALFTMEVIYYFIIKMSNRMKKMYANGLILLFLMISGWIFTLVLSNIYLPWGLNSTLELGSFFFIGFLLKKYNAFDQKSILIKPYIQIILLIIGLIALNFNTIVSCIDYRYGNFGLMQATGICFSLVTIYIAYLIHKNKILEYIGMNTMGILIFHKLIILVCQTKLGIISGYLKSSNIILEFGLGLFISVLSIGGALIATEIIRRILPILIGEKNILKYRINS